MCCFSRPIKHVSKTRIFARDTGTKQQVLVYSMSLALIEDTAMVLPLPVELSDGKPPAEDAVRFIDLSGYATFFDDLDPAFPELLGAPKGRGTLRFLQQSTRSRLHVHSVGAFDASFVPSPRDFDRLEPRFRLPPKAFDDLPGYKDYGFAVFKLKRPRSVWARLRGKAHSYHPMAFSFARRRPSEVFFPTVHIHDGQVHARADFDHTLYLQAAANAEPKGDWQRSFGPLSQHLAQKKADAICDLNAPGFRCLLIGSQPNQDVRVDLRPATAASTSPST